MSAALLLFYALAALILLLIAMLVVVQISRHMAGGARRARSLDARLRQAFGQTDKQAPSDESDNDGAQTSTGAGGSPSTDEQKKKQGVAVAIVSAAAAILVGLAAALSDSDDDNMPPVQTEISAGDLHGTLLSPHDDAPVVLIVPGSGPTDRNGDNPMGMKTGAYRLLAEGLAGEGIASVRVDKRGMFGSTGAGNANDVSIDIYARDYRAWIDAIRAQRDVDCVWLLGHSEGALMVSAAAEGRKDVCGLILVSGMGRRMSDVIRDQLKSNPANAPVLDTALAAISEIEAGRRVDTTDMHPALLALFAPAVQDYLISVFPVDPVEVLRRAKKRALIVQGTTDIQVSVADARLLDRVRRTRLEIIEGMNHVLKEAPADRAANIATYSNPDLPLAPDLVEEIADFIDDED